MDPKSLAIPLAFILLAAVLCLLLIGSKWKWWQKLALIIIVPSFGLVVWASLGSYKGWPTTSDPPEKSLVCWMLVREPDLARGDPGAIFLWLVPYDEKKTALNPLAYSSPGDEPRAYALPYSRSLHKGLDRVKGVIKEGRPVVLDLSGPPQGEDGTESEDDSVQGSGGDAGPGGQGGRTPHHGDPNRSHGFNIYPLPPPHPPQKMPEH